MYIYAIGNEDGPVKIGITYELGGRLRALRTSCPFPIEIIHAERMPSRSKARRMETVIHAVYREKRLCGEWFSIDADQAWEAIDTAVETARAFDGAL